MKLPKNCIIAEIPYPGLREVAIKRIYARNSHWDINIRTVYSLPWTSSPEGGAYWKNVYYGNYDGRFEKHTLKRI